MREITKSIISVNVFVVVLNHEFYVPYVYMFINLHFQGTTLEYNLE